MGIFSAAVSPPPLSNIDWKYFLDFFKNVLDKIEKYGKSFFPAAAPPPPLSNIDWYPAKKEGFGFYPIIHKNPDSENIHIFMESQF